MAKREENRGFATTTVSAEGGAVSSEYQRYGRNKSTVINKTYIESGEFRRKFDRITEDANLARLLYNKAKEMLYHRSGTEYEDMYWISVGSCCVLASVLNEKSIEQITYTSGIFDTIRDYDDIITIHTHPHSMPPSIEDINANHMYGYRRGIVVCHNGQVYVYGSEEEISERLYDFYRIEFVEEGYTEKESQLKALIKIADNHRMYIKEVIV